MPSAVEQLKEAEAYKEEGNRHHNEGNYKRALAAYHKDLSRPMAQGYNPKAACYLKTGEPQKCVDACSQALDLGASSKGHFRRAQAYAELRNLSGATADLERARQLAPDDPAIDVELKKLRRSFSQADASEKKRYAEMFAKAPAGQDSGSGPCEIEEVAESAAAPAPAELPAPEVASREARQGSTPAELPAPEAASGEGEELQRVAEPAKGGSIVLPASSEVQDEAPKLSVEVRQLTYAWEQTDEQVKIYISFDQSDELEAGVEESRVKVDFGEWSASLVIDAAAEGQTPWGLRLADFHRRVAPDRCSCTVRSKRITLKLKKREKEHWWNLLQRGH
eukprot:TRINITY_DN28938_c0_g1_i2.p1 TRINITY_DN28938_c0_g1~~TRINITY_DN28938_c0_g1_i2.p1  ORF type:complete len:346 (-),score=88.53 TRINITY_DN28938_c0_g1_i2:95-1102(-)